MDSVKSVNKVPIRLNEERWAHIVENHCELAGQYHDVLDAVATPNIVVKGFEGELLAIKKISGHKHLVVVYKEIRKSDGFVITAFISSKVAKLMRRKILWKQEER